MRTISKEQAQALFTDYAKLHNPWSLPRYDGRKKIFKGITREEWRELVAKCFTRYQTRFQPEPVNKLQRAKEILRYFAQIPYNYCGDGMDDFNKYQRPSSNGIGWVAICPGEPGNNYYVDDPLIVSMLKKRYTAYLGTLK